VNPATLIDTVLAYSDDLPPSDGNNTPRRARVLQYLQEVCEDVWNYHEWLFTYKRTTAFSLTASATAIDLPSDFLEIGRHGGLWENAGDHHWTEVGPQELSAVREGSTLTTPRIYSIFGINGTSGLKTIQVISSGSTRTMTLVYRFLFPTLTDETDDAGLKNVPLQYHNSVLLAGVTAKTRESSNDARDWQSKYIRGLGYMVARELPGKSAVAKVPRAINNW
jgi:hypothetical protein